MKKLHIIFTASFVNSIMLNGMLLAIVLYAKNRFGALPTQTARIVLCYNLAYVFGCLAGQPLLSRFSPQKNVVIAMVWFFAGALFCRFGTSLTWLYTGEFFLGIGTSFFWPPLMGWLSEGYEGEQLARVAGFYNLTWSTATIVAPVSMGALCDLNDIYPLTLLVAVYAIQLPVFIAIYLANRRPSGQNSRQEETVQGEQTPLRYPSWYGIACSWCIVGFLTGVYPNAAKELLEISSSRIGFIYTLRSAGQSIALIALGIFTFWQFKRWQLFAGHFATACFIFLLGFATTPGMVLVCLIPLGIFSAHSYTNSMIHGIAGSKNRTQRMAIHEVLLSVGTILGAAICGHLFQYYGLKPACTFCAIVMLSAAICDLLPWGAPSKKAH